MRALSSFSAAEQRAILALVRLAEATTTRCSVVIPKSHRHDLFDYRSWSSVTDADALPDLTAFGDPSRWFVFTRRIPLGWLRDAESRPIGLAG